MAGQNEHLKRLEALVERFDQNLYAIKSSQYNETQVRREFIDPFFSLLGWDMDNREGYAEAYKDVIHEDAIKVGGYTKAPDYCFRVGGARKFFVEAKKPAVNIKDAPDPAYQLRRYAWSAKLPLSILTDFEEFAVYDCRTKPSPSDKSSVGRVQFVGFRGYIQQWDEIASVFSREAVLKGSFDKFVESSRAKRGTAEVDAAFLQEIESWREGLAKNLALRNPSLSTRDLNYAVQATLDRIIFLRICEDRGVEDYARLMALLNGERVYKRLMELFRSADDRYNSGLFHFDPEKGRPEAPDTLTPRLCVDDKALKDIIGSLYYPDSPYEFSVLPADILGQVYEQFLGKVIRLTAGHQAKVEDKPEVKKAGGVYYTPTYIVDYIVRNTLGRMLEGKTPSEVSGKVPKGGRPLRVLDPACGSGSFLLGAYQHLLDWYRDRYIENGAEKWARGKEPKLYQAQHSQWKLTTAERKRILLAHIYGVDIDSQAVEVTKLSLLLKVLEGETKESISYQRKLFHERALPDLAQNIKCGNSLIGSDFYKGPAVGLFDEEERARINAFDWEDEFLEVLQSGRGLPTENRGSAEKSRGFDVVLGNPPYGAFFTDAEKDYIRATYRTFNYRYDSYIYFFEKGTELLRHDGLLSFITPAMWLQLDTCDCLRRFLFAKMQFQSLWVLGESVFKKAIVSTVVSVLARSSTPRALDVYSNAGNWKIPHDSWADGHGSPIDYRVHPRAAKLVKSIRNASNCTLADVGEAIQGVTPYDRYRGQSPKTIKERAYHLRSKQDGTCEKWLAGEDVGRYSLKWGGEWLRYGPWLAAPRDPRFFGGSRLLFREVPGPGKRIQATMAEETFYHGHSITPFKVFEVVPLSLEYLLGLANCRLTSWFASMTLSNFGKEVFPKLNPQDIKAIPLPRLDVESEKGKSCHSRMVRLVDQMLTLHKQLMAARVEQDKTLLRRHVEVTDKEIDRLVYELYGLTDEQIAIVEGAV